MCIPICSPYRKIEITRVSSKCFQSTSSLFLTLTSTYIIMSTYFHDSNARDEEHFGLVNLLNDDNFLLEDNRSLLDTTENPSTFCVRCRSLSNSGINDEWDSSYDHTCNRHIHRNDLQDGALTRLVKNGRDGADTIPLLSHSVSRPSLRLYI